MNRTYGQCFIFSFQTKGRIKGLQTEIISFPKTEMITAFGDLRNSAGFHDDQAERRWAASSSASSRFSLISTSVRTNRVHSSFRGTAICYGEKRKTLCVICERFGKRCKAAQWTSRLFWEWTDPCLTILHLILLLYLLSSHLVSDRGPLWPWRAVLLGPLSDRRVIVVCVIFRGSAWAFYTTVSVTEREREGESRSTSRPGAEGVAV